MPLRKGRSKKTISSNIKEMVHKFKKSGKIGSSKPGSMRKAIAIAAAAAFRKAGKSRKRRKRRK